MNPAIFLRPKGVITGLFGVLMIINPNWVVNLMGAELFAGGETLIRVFCLPFLALGYSMAVTPMQGATVDTRETLITVCCEALAVYFIFTATLAGTFNALGYVLSAIYLVSGCGFFYCYLCGRQQADSSTSA